MSEGNCLAAPKPPTHVVGMETCISCSCCVPVPGSNCVSGITLIPRPSRARDLVTMSEVVYARLTSLERVTTGAGSVSRGTRAEPNSLSRSLRLSLSGGVVSMTSYPKFAIYGQKMHNNSGTDLPVRYDKFNVYHNTMLRTAMLPTSWRSN